MKISEQGRVLYDEFIQSLGSGSYTVAEVNLALEKFLKDKVPEDNVLLRDAV